MKSWMWGVAGAVVASVAMLFITSFLASNKAGADAPTHLMKIRSRPSSRLNWHWP